MFPIYSLYLTIHLLQNLCIYNLPSPNFLNICRHITHLFSSVQFSRSVMSNSLWPHELQQARPPCPLPTPRVHPNPSPLSRGCHPTISSCVQPFSSCPQSFLVSGSFPQYCKNIYWRGVYNQKGLQILSLQNPRSQSPHTMVCHLRTQKQGRGWINWWLSLSAEAASGSDNFFDQTLHLQSYIQLLSNTLTYTHAHSDGRQPNYFDASITHFLPVNIKLNFSPPRVRWYSLVVIETKSTSSLYGWQQFSTPTRYCKISSSEAKF